MRAMRKSLDDTEDQTMAEQEKTPDIAFEGEQDTMPQAGAIAQYIKDLSAENPSAPACGIVSCSPSKAMSGVFSCSAMVWSSVSSRDFRIARMVPALAAAPSSRHKAVQWDEALAPCCGASFESVRCRHYVGLVGAPRPRAVLKV